MLVFRPGAATAITLVAVVALLCALNANLYGASRMAFSLAERDEAPRWLASVSNARVPVVAVLASVAFGVVTVVLELMFPEMVLGVLLNIVGSTCLLVWTSALLAQLALRLRVDREGTDLPLRVPGFPWFTVVGLVILGAIFTVGFIGEESRPQLLSTFALVTVLAVGCWLNYRKRKVVPSVEAAEGNQAVWAHRLTETLRTNSRTSICTRARPAFAGRAFCIANPSPGEPTLLAMGGRTTTC